MGGSQSSQSSNAVVPAADNNTRSASGGSAEQEDANAEQRASFDGLSCTTACLLAFLCGCFAYLHASIAMGVLALVIANQRSTSAASTSAPSSSSPDNSEEAAMADYTRWLQTAQAQVLTEKHRAQALQDRNSKLVRALERAAAKERAANERAQAAEARAIAAERDATDARKVARLAVEDADEALARSMARQEEMAAAADAAAAAVATSQERSNGTSTVVHDERLLEQARAEVQAELRSTQDAASLTVAEMLNQLQAVETEYRDRASAERDTNAAAAASSAESALRNSVECGICLGPVTEPAITPCCKNMWCKACIEEALHARQQCPICRKPLACQDLIIVAGQSTS